MPALAEGLIPFFIIAGSFVLLGLSQMHASAHGGSGVIGFLERVATGSVAKLINLAAQATRALTSRFAAAQLGLVAAWLSATATLWKFVFQSNAEYAHAATRAIEAVWDDIRPEAKRAAAPAMARAKVADRHAHHALDLGHANAGELTRFKGRTNARLNHQAHAIDVTLPRDIGHVRRREEELARDQAKLRERTGLLERGAEKTFDWIRSHPLSAVTEVFAGAVAVALARLGFGFLRCRSWRRLGRSMTCGMGSWILKSLELVAGFALGYLAVLKPEVLAEEAVDAVDGIEWVLTKILDN